MASEELRNPARGQLHNFEKSKRMTQITIRVIRVQLNQEAKAFSAFARTKA